MVEGGWFDHVDAIANGETCRVLGKGEGWIAWAEASIERGISRCFSVQADDGETIRTVKIGTVCQTADVAGLLSAVAKYSEREREKALRAIEALEGGDA